MKTEENDLSINLMVFYYYAAKTLESSDYLFRQRVNTRLYFYNRHTECEIVIRYHYDYLCIFDASCCPPLMEKLMEHDLFQLAEDSPHALMANLKMPFQKVWSHVRVHFTDEEVLKIFAHDFGRARYLKDSQERRAKCEEGFFSPPDDMPSRDFI
ncbi:MAG: hypothetical protein WC205_18375 [Opitutaceae bacterium]|jgi:hypothetical protein